jgi:transposase
MPDHDLFGETPSLRPPRKKATHSPVFKPYTQNQPMLLPIDLEELIPKNHMVRVVNDTIDNLNVEPLLSTYKGGGTSAYHPVMLLKVLIYAYISKTYAVRSIAKALRENVYFMWLSGTNTPDFRTINEFRSGRLRNVIEDVFTSMVIFLSDNNYVTLEDYFIDGSKFRANANKHKVVWAKNTKRYKENVTKEIRELFDYIETLNEEDDKRFGNRDLAELGQESTLTSERVKEQVEKLNTLIEQLQEHTESSPQNETPSEKNVNSSLKEKDDNKVQKKTDKRLKSLQKTLKEKLLPKLEKYEQQEALLDGRNSYSRTDPSATFFRRKDGSLLPSYNLIVGSQNQFILNYTFHQQKGSETDAFVPHMNAYYDRYCSYPLRVIGDAAYGSEENYAFLAAKKIGNYLKYPDYYKEQKKKHQDNLYTKDKFLCDAETDTYLCPQERTLSFQKTKEVRTANGYVAQVRVYQCDDCSECPVALQCKRTLGNRTIQVNRTLETYRAQARTNLSSLKGALLRILRNIDIESVFGDLKFNQNYERFRLRGEEKVNTEFGILAMAHNTKKLALWTT